MPRKTTRAAKTSPAKKPKPRVPRRETQPVAPSKPVFRATTWITVLVFAALIGFAVYLNRKDKSALLNATPSATVSYVFTSEDGLPSSIEIKPADSDSVRLARNADNAWALELPETAEADQGQAEAAATSVTTLKILNEINLAADVLGLDKPAYTITIKFTGGSEHILAVGDKTPTNNGYYAELDKKKMYIVSLDGVDSLLNLVTAPPYLQTPTPSPLPPTETPVPPSATSTPEITVTPTP